jgi:hypothetical protein
LFQDQLCNSLADGHCPLPTEFVQTDQLTALRHGSGDGKGRSDL